MNSFTYRHLLSLIYLFFSFLGAVLTALANINFIREYGPSFDILKFIDLANANPAAASLSRDLLIGAGAFTLWMFVERARLEIKNFWLVLASTFLIAFACGGPLFLFLRERRLMELSRNT